MKSALPLVLCCTNQIAYVLPIDVLEGSRVVETSLSNEVRGERIKAGVQTVADHVDVGALDSCHQWCDSTVCTRVEQRVISDFTQD